LRDLPFSPSQSRLPSSGTTAPSSPRAAGNNGAAMSLIVEGLKKRFGAHAALNSVSFTMQRGGFLALLGPSGSGKTTLLRLLGGLEHADSGAVTYEGQDWLGVPTRERRAGFVFQNYALFRHMTVAENVAFGLRVRPYRRRPRRAEIRRRVEELLALVQLEGVGDRYPSQLSGGQRQRVALARALAIEPKLLLLDEPFGALDAKVRKDLRRWLRDLHDRLGLTTIFVTHDQDEALDLADDVAVLNDGRIEQMDAPENVYARPRTAFVAEFLGGANRLRGKVLGGCFLIDGVSLPLNSSHAPEGDTVAFVRPHELALAREGEPAIPATVTNVLTAGSAVRIDCLRQSGEVVEMALSNGTQPPRVGQHVHLKLLVQRLYPAQV
jgi:sulfate/thiosulfate transport system ATP-binding protein